MTTVDTGSGSPQSRHARAAELWDCFKKEIEKLYLDQNWTLDEVQEVLFRRYGFHATKRQYKTKLKNWGFDSKKIRGDVWASMHLIHSKHKPDDGDIVFEVPLRGSQTKIIGPDQIAKQMRRNTTEINDLKVAFETLEKNNIRFRRATKQSQSLSHSCVPCSSTSAPLSQSIYWPQSPQFPGTSLPVTTESQSSFPTLSVGMAANPCFQQNWAPMLQSDSVLKHDISPTSSRGFLPEYFPTHHQHEPYQASYENFDLSVAFSELSADESYNEAERYNLQLLSDGQTSLMAPCPPLTREKRVATQWAAFYVLRCLPKSMRIVASSDDVSRKTAKQLFDALLQNHNKFVYPFCNTVMSVIAANAEDPETQLIEFLSDCCEVIGKDSSKEKWYGWAFRLALAKSRKDEAEMQLYSKQLECSADVYSLVWSRLSPNYLVNQYHIAWHKLDQNSFYDALLILRQCLPDLERVMGRQHVTTINCLTILSRAYTGINDLCNATLCLEDALDRLSDCALLFRAFRYKLVHRLSQVQELTGDLMSAETNMQSVINFRHGHFGIDSEITWSAINSLLALLRRQHRYDEANAFEQRYTTAFDRQKINDWTETYEVRPAWVCEFCDQPKSNTCCLYNVHASDTMYYNANNNQTCLSVHPGMARYRQPFQIYS